MREFIAEILEILVDLFIYPIDTVMSNDGSGKYLYNHTIKIGFGSIEWINMQLDDLIIVVLGIALSTIIIVFIFKLLKWLTRFGGRKKW